MLTGARRVAVAARDRAQDFADRHRVERVLDSYEGLANDPELVQRAASGVPKSVLAGDYGISRETVYQYLRQARLS